MVVCNPDNYDYACLTDFTFQLARWVPMQPAIIDPTLDLSTKGTYNRWVDQGGMEYQVCLTLLTAQKVTIHQVTTMLTTSRNVLFPGHNHLLNGANDPTL